MLDRGPAGALIGPGLVGAGFILAALVAAAGGSYAAYVIAGAAAACLVVLSLTLVTGMAGQISLAQPAFAGMGAYSAALVEAGGGGFWAALAVAVAAGMGLGLLVGLPALRLRGAHLAIATLGLAVVVDRSVFQLPQSGGLSGIRLLRPDGWLGSNLGFCLLSLAILGAVLLAMVRLRESPTGWRLRAIRDDERAALAAGVDVPVHKVVAFGASGAMAALGGAMGGHLALHINPLDFSPFRAVAYLALVVVAGRTSLVGAVAAGALSAVLPQVVSAWTGGRVTAVLPALVLPVLLMAGLLVRSRRAPRRLGAPS